MQVQPLLASLRTHQFQQELKRLVAMQAAMVCSMCHAALHDVICDSGTCIQLLMTAEAQHWRSLESR